MITIFSSGLGVAFEIFRDGLMMKIRATEMIRVDIKLKKLPKYRRLPI